jgi:uncharacterized protein (TIGR02001 family)
MNKVSYLLNRQVLAALCATPLMFASAGVSADEAPTAVEEMAAPAEAIPAAEATPAAEAAPAAAAAPAEPASPFTFTFNLGLYSDYVFRGVSLSDGPALQGGADLGHSSGFYVGTWWSNIDADFTGHGDGFSDGNSLETDWYAGYAHTFDNGFGVNVLGNYYYYPNRENSYSAANVGRKQNSFEASIALTYSYFTYTYYRVLTDYYGAAKDGTKDGTSDTKGADYHEFKTNFKLPVGDFNAMAKIGYQHTPNLTGSQGDYAFGLNRDFSLPSGGKPIEGFNAGGYYTNTFDVENQAYYDSSSGRDTNHGKFWFFVKRTW